MQLLERSRDVVTGEVSLEDLHSLRDFPVFMGCVDQGLKEDVVADMTWQVARRSGVIQLKRLIPLEVLYQAQHAGSVGDIWMSHHKAFSTFLSKRAPSSVLEIGGAHGILAKEYQLLRKIPWTILEPNPAPVAGCEARFIRGFFDAAFRYAEPFDTLVHSHVFEHMYEPDTFMEHLARLIGVGKHLVFSLPNMQAMLERKYTNCINFEHTVFLTEPYVEFLLARHGFRLLSKEYFLPDHSVFYEAIRDSSVLATDLPVGLYEKNKKLYMDYVRFHEDLISELNDQLGAIIDPIYLFGAHVFAQYLIAFGLDTRRIVSLLDNDPKKHGKRLYGTALKVHSPRALASIARPVVILKAGVYNDEIKRDILENINGRAVFL